LLGHVLEPVLGEFGLGPNAAKQQFMNDVGGGLNVAEKRRFENPGAVKQ
jgi:hypothetical protein